jgi:hypothetical protein
MDKKDSSHKQRECLEEVSKRPFQAPCDPCERRGFGVSGAGRPTVTSLKTGCVGGDNNLDQTERASSRQAWLVRSSFNPRTRPFPNRLSRLNTKNVVGCPRWLLRSPSATGGRVPSVKILSTRCKSDACYLVPGPPIDRKRSLASAGDFGRCCPVPVIPAVVAESV